MNSQTTVRDAPSEARTSSLSPTTRFWAEDSRKSVFSLRRCSITWVIYREDLSNPQEFFVQTFNQYNNISLRHGL